MKEIIFQNEDQLIQAEEVFDTAVSRVLNKVSADEEPTNDFLESLWNNIALSVIHDGYKAAMDYARNANFRVPTVKKYTKTEYDER